MYYNMRMSVTLKAPLELLGKIESFYIGQKAESPSEYIAAYYKGEGYNLSVYKKEDGLTLLFQGKNAKKEAAIWLPFDGIEEKEKKETKDVSCKIVYPMIGSDEVGNGSFFGGMAVAAAYVERKDIPFLKSLGVRDSKKAQDALILEAVPKLIGRIDYSYLYLDPRKYNESRLVKGLNLNSMKALMHNAVLLNLQKRHPMTRAYVDQFCSPKAYFSYLRDAPEVVREITFETKGEEKFYAVAAGSFIARYGFLKEMEKMGRKYGVAFPQGASSEVEDFAVGFLKGRPEAADFTCKKDFSTYSRILDRLGL